MQNQHTPQRIVCLAAEAAEILDQLGAFDRVVGVSGFTRRPERARELPKIGGFANPDVEKILGLKPDLAITITDIQAGIAKELIGAGIPVLALNPHHLADVFLNIRLVGGAVGLQPEAEVLVGAVTAELETLRGDPGAARPRVYFEEWDSPMISAIGWIGDLIALTGGEDIFAELGTQPLARLRIIQPEDVLARRPDLIIASWCGKKANLASICARPGWETIPAVQTGRVFEIDSDILLQTGPSLVEGARALRNLIAAA